MLVLAILTLAVILIAIPMDQRTKTVVLIVMGVIVVLMLFGVFPMGTVPWRS